MCEFSNASLCFISIPFLLALPDAITIASGVARPRLHGHATTNMLTKIFIANAKSLDMMHHITKAILAITRIVGTNTPLILSATFAIGAFVDVAFATSLTISETVDSLPIFSALYLIVPSKFILPAITFAPASFFTGVLSPVIKASFMCVVPSTTSPSTAIFSPGLQITMSPFCISSIVTLISFPSLIITASFGVILIRACKASFVLSLFLFSINFPIFIKKITMAADSKYSFSTYSVLPVKILAVP